MPDLGVGISRREKGCLLLYRLCGDWEDGAGGGGIRKFDRAVISSVLVLLCKTCSYFCRMGSRESSHGKCLKPCIYRVVGVGEGKEILDTRDRKARALVGVYSLCVHQAGER